LRDGKQWGPVPAHLRADRAHDRRHGLHDGMRALPGKIRRTRRDAGRGPSTRRSGPSH
jgi:hypothetical protein